MFDDGSGPWYIEDNLVTETPVLLQGTSVTSTSGTSTTLFTVSTTYSEGQNSAPTSAQLFIDTIAYPMSRVTLCDYSNCQGLFLIIEPRLNTLSLLQIRRELVR